MLKLRPEQIRVFQPDAEAAFERRVVDYLKKNHAAVKIFLPEKSAAVADLPDEIFSRMVGSALRRARSHGIDWKSTLLAFVVLMAVAAPNFDRHPKASKFFAENENIGDEQLENFLSKMTDDDWAEVEANYDARAWQIEIKGETIL